MHVRGSMTLEAAILMPVILVLMLMSVQYAVYVHDTVVCQAFLDSHEPSGGYALVKVPGLIHGSGHAEVVLADAGNSLLFKDMQAQLTYIGSYLGKPVRIEVSKKVRRIDPADTITQIDFIDDLIDDRWYNEER